MRLSYRLLAILALVAVAEICFGVWLYNRGWLLEVFVALLGVLVIVAAFARHFYPPELPPED